MRDDVFEDKMAEVESLEQEMTDEPMFEASAIKPVIKAMNALVDVFDAPKVTPETFNGSLKMFIAAMNDAVADGAIDEMFECEPPQTEVDLKYLAGKLNLLAKPKHKKAFMRFLDEKADMPEDDMPAENVPSETTPIESDPVLRALGL